MPDARPRSNSKFFTGNGMWAGYSYGASGTALSAPTLVLTTPNLTYPPQFSAGLDDTYDVAQSDALTLIGRNKAGSVIYTFGPHIITLAEATAVPPAAIFTGLSAVVSGTTRWTVFGQRPGQGVSASSTPIIIQGPDDVEPVLTLPTAVMVSSSAGTIGVTTDTAEGTLYYVATLTNSAPSKAQIKLGQNAAGAAASYAGSQAVTTTGAKTATATGLTATTTYYSWFMHEDVAVNQSLVAAAAAFTTDVAAAFSMAQTAAPATQNIAFAAVTATFSGASFGAQDSARKMLIGVLCDAALTGVTVGGIAATQLGTANHNQSLWQATVPTGATGTVVVTAGASISYCGITVASVIGAGTGPTVETPLAFSFNNSPQAISVTTPTGGATYILGEFITAGTAAFTNATKQSQDSSVSETITAAIRSTSGAASISVTGFGNSNSALNAVSYGP